MEKEFDELNHDELATLCHQAQSCVLDLLASK